MSLATRLCAFFLAALAVVLLGFSATLFLAARIYLTGELDERLDRALDTLEASVDIEPGGLEWEPADRRMVLGVNRADTAVRWVVRDGPGVVVDLSANSRDENFPIAWASARWPVGLGDGTMFGRAPGWRLASRRLDLEELLHRAAATLTTSRATRFPTLHCFLSPGSSPDLCKQPSAGSALHSRRYRP